jgi:hypothetical protein
VIVVSDTSVITALIQIGRVEMLSELFGIVVIPEAVADELAVCHVGLPAWIQVKEVRSKEDVQKWAVTLDAGESEAIALALELSADFLLIDEKAGRAAAQSVGLDVVGVLGVISEAKRAGLVLSVTEVIRELREIAAFRISSALESRVLRDAGDA